MLNRLVELSLRYKVLVLIVFAVIAFLGVRAVRTVPIDAFPDVTPVQVSIYTESPGLAAEDVEQLLTFPVESAMAGLPKVPPEPPRPSAASSSRSASSKSCVYRGSEPSASTVMIKLPFVWVASTRTSLGFRCAKDAP